MMAGRKKRVKDTVSQEPICIDASTDSPIKLAVNQLPQVREMLLKHQNNRCPLCNIDLSTLTSKQQHVDHDHSKTGPSRGAIRAVLCGNCNMKEGPINNRAIRAKRKLTKIEWLENLLNYWKKHQSNQTGLIHPQHKGKI